MKRKLLAALLAMCLVVAALPVGASAAATENCPGECQHAAAIGGTHYNTLAEALNAAEDGDTVTLLQDASTEPVTIDKGITLDLGGKTLSLVQDSTTNAVGLAFTNQGENVLKNGILYDGRSDGNTSAGFIAVRLTGGGTLTTEDVEIQSYQPDSDKNYNYLVRADGKTGALVLKSGTVLKELERTTTQSEITYGTVGVAVFGGYATQTTEFEETIDVTVEDGVTIQTMGFAISGNGSDRNGTNITINGGDITSTGAQAIYHPQYGTLTVNGGNITGTTGIEMRSGVLHVLEDATIVGTAVPTDVDANGNGSTTVGAGVAIAQHTTKLPINVTITGGTIQGYTGLYESNPQSNPEDAIEKIKISIAGGNFSAINGGINAVFSQDCKGFISGGYFTSDPTAYLAEGKVAVPSTEPGYSYTVAQKEDAAAEVVVAAPNVPEVDTSLPQCQVMNSKRVKKYPSPEKEKGIVLLYNNSFVVKQSSKRILKSSIH